MAKTIKMCDMYPPISVTVFKMLNPGKVDVVQRPYGKVIVTDIEPKNLTYPEGWYYAKGTFRNKHTSSTGIYCEIDMEKSNGKSWSETAKYCTLYED